MNLVLDAEAVVALVERGHQHRRQVRQSVDAAHRIGRVVTVATLTLAELYRGTRRGQALDALLSREGDALVLRDTDRALARLVGSLLTEAGAGSELLADAHVVAVAVEAGGGVVLTGDPDDLARLAAASRTVTIEALR